MNRYTNHHITLIAGLAIAALVAACNKAPSTSEAEPSLTPAPTAPAPGMPSSTPDATTSPAPGSMPPSQPGSGTN